MKSGDGTAAVVPLVLWISHSVALAQGKPEKERIRIGHAARAVAHSMPFVATEAGFFSHLYLGSNEVMWSALMRLADQWGALYNC